MSLLEVKNLQVQFKNSEGFAVDGFSFTLEAGESLAIVGESGSGKSVCAHSLLQLLPKTAQVQGEVLFEGKNLLEVNEQQIRALRSNEISMIFQEPMSSLNPVHSIEKQINEVLETHKGMRKTQASKKTAELLELVGIPKEKMKSFAHELSGGQRQRVMIAMALANEPKVLIADEPTTALDVTVQAQILELIKKVQKQFNMALILITHDLGVVKHFSNRVCVVHHAKMIEQGTTQEIFSQPKEAYTKELILADRFESEYLEPLNTKEVLKAEHLAVRFLTKQYWFRSNEYYHALNALNMSLLKGECLGIVGESGSGKSTLALALLKLISSEGSILYEDQRIDKLDKHAFRPFRKDIQVVFQDPYGSLSPKMSVEEIITEGLEVHNIGSKKERSFMVETILEEVGLKASYKNRYPHEFSGGQRQRISIARALVLKPKILILDEPTSALDRSVQYQVVQLLKSLQERYGLSYIFISHDLKVIRAMCNRIMVLKAGELMESGSSKEIFTAPKTAYTKALIQAAYEL